MSAPTYTDTLEAFALELTKRLVELGESAAVEAAIVAVIDPHYARLSERDPMMRLLILCERVRQVTGLLVLPKAAGPEEPAESQGGKAHQGNLRRGEGPDRSGNRATRDMRRGKG